MVIELHPLELLGITDRVLQVGNPAESPPVQQLQIQLVGHPPVRLAQQEGLLAGSQHEAERARGHGNPGQQAYENQPEHPFRQQHAGGDGQHGREQGQRQQFQQDLAQETSDGETRVQTREQQADCKDRDIDAHHAPVRPFGAGAHAEGQPDRGQAQQ